MNDKTAWASARAVAFVAEQSLTTNLQEAMITYIA